MIEVRDVRQNPKEYFRRWFSDDHFDLYVWFKPDDTIYGFELSYDKDSQEKALRWFSDRGLSHYRVEESSYLNRSAMLIPMNGRLEMDRTLALFQEVDDGLPQSFKNLVSDKIMEYGDLQKQSH